MLNPGSSAEKLMLFEQEKFVISPGRVVLLVGLIVVLVIGGYWLEHHIVRMEGWIESLGYWAGVGFILLFLVLTPLFFSVDALCLIAGAVFSLPAAFAYVLIATMLASALIFAIGRWIARENIQTFVAKNEKLRSIDRLLQHGSFKILFLLRLLPIPFAPLSYAMSVSKTRFGPYWLATTGIFFYHLIITYFGYSAAHFSKQMIQGGQATGPSAAMLAGGFILCIAVVFLILRVARSELAQISEFSG